MSFTTLIFAWMSGKAFECSPLCKCTVHVGVELSVKSSDNRQISDLILSPHISPEIDGYFTWVLVFNLVTHFLYITHFMAAAEMFLLFLSIVILGGEMRQLYYFSVDGEQIIW